jgi:hypothetical protein|tara:strand:- start:116 stop:340 length:225 start_codon:yes stop_codon:yes gene_type:complete
MQKSYFYNNKLADENKEKKFIQKSIASPKGVVDINILLNRVKSEEKNETKRKIIFFSFSIFALSLFGTFIIMIK